jgi:hypothetical protein
MYTCQVKEDETTQPLHQQDICDIRELGNESLIKHSEFHVGLISIRNIYF